MSDEQEPWARQEEEPNLWYDRFMLFLLLGPSRSLRKTIEQATKSDEKRQISVPQSWLDASHKWSWRERAESWDEYRRRQVFTEGNAYDLARIEKLNKYSQRLEQQLDLMLDSMPKKIRKPWFNHFMYEKYLQSLDALAQETGGRVKKQDITSAGEKLDGPQVIFYMPEVPPEEGYDG